MLRSIVHQLLEAEPTLYNKSISIFRSKAQLHQQGDWQWRQSELKEYLNSVVQQPPPRPLLLLVDALDECDESEVRDVVAFLESLSITASQNGIPVRICLSSRHYPTIRMNKALELIVEANINHERDIANYIGGKLRVRDTGIEYEIQRRAEGVFLWVVVVVSLLNKAYDEGRIEAMRKCLEEEIGRAHV